MREYRKKITEIGQHSPEYLNNYIQEVLQILPLPDILKIADIGCGTGFQVEILKNKYDQMKYIGVDFSKSTIDYLKETTIFDELYLSSSNNLPLPDNYVDVSICMENLEHLYYEDVIDALSELKRISKYIIITTPTPETVINIRWLNKEINEAANDDISLTEKDYVCLECCVHKSVIYPKSFHEAGFKQIKVYGSESECYYAESSQLDLSKITHVGIKKSSLLNNDNYKEKYLDLLNKSLLLKNDIILHL